MGLGFKHPSMSAIYAITWADWQLSGQPTKLWRNWNKYTVLYKISDVQAKRFKTGGEHLKVQLFVLPNPLF